MRPSLCIIHCHFTALEILCTAAIPPVPHCHCSFTVSIVLSFQKVCVFIFCTAFFDIILVSFCSCIFSRLDIRLFIFLFFFFWCIHIPHFIYWRTTWLLEYFWQLWLKLLQISGHKLFNVHITFHFIWVNAKEYDRRIIE